MTKLLDSQVAGDRGKHVPCTKFQEAVHQSGQGVVSGGDRGGSHWRITGCEAQSEGWCCFWKDWGGRHVRCCEFFKWYVREHHRHGMILWRAGNLLKISAFTLLGLVLIVQNISGTRIMRLVNSIIHLFCSHNVDYECAFVVDWARNSNVLCCTSFLERLYVVCRSMDHQA